jgi:hypothetical protein
MLFGRYAASHALEGEVAAQGSKLSDELVGVSLWIVGWTK